MLPDRLGRYTDQWAGTSPRPAVLLAGLLVVSAACGICAQALGSPLERGWLAADWQGWPGPARRLAHRRTVRRQARYSLRRDAVGRAGAEFGPGEAVTRFHFPDLARQLGIVGEGPPTRRTGELLTEYLASGRLPE
ncbi:hypothetical protein [Streptomyces sp. XD-27]|uniref:hypothetical protein n=1 Tax=Streptomyces sp. XD-27 TaxID=3062779 RepID=UPI0026F441F0|nr:hypothetical protein [Streptomyces sp. XD-27]WKX71612.1 hypothetical protein Q3Y56_18315 [Streptomyces sp. XD-27]